MKSDQALELRNGETDRFYFIFANMLATGDAITGTPTVVCAGATVAGVSRNSTPLTYDGVEYAADTVVYCDVSAIANGDNVELICTVTTTAGRILRSSIWIKGITNYAD